MVLHKLLGEKQIPLNHSNVSIINCTLLNPLNSHHSFKTKAYVYTLVYLQQSRIRDPRLSEIQAFSSLCMY